MGCETRKPTGSSRGNSIRKNAVAYLRTVQIGRISLRPRNIESSVVSNRAPFSYDRSVHQPLAAIRSSIRSRSTSQYLSAESRSLSIPSASVDPLLSDISRRHCVEGLLDLCRLRFDFDIRQCLRRRGASINIPPMNPFLLVCSHHGAGTVVPNHSAARTAVFVQIKLPNRSRGSKNRYDGHAKLESAPWDFRADFGLRQVRRAAPNTFGDRRAPS